MFKQTVPKDWLLKKLRENRDDHRDTFEIAFDRYQQKMVDDLERALVEVRNGDYPSVRFHWDIPQDHTEDYDAIIGLLENSQEDTIEMDESAFRTYVLDNWGWKAQWTTTNSSYGVGN